MTRRTPARRPSRTLTPQSAIATLLVYGIIMPLEIVFFYVFIPTLLKEHMDHMRNPLEMRRYPYRTALPASPVYYLCMRRPELRATPVGDHALCRGKAHAPLDEGHILCPRRLLSTPPRRSSRNH
mgnify:CR=1 FL=1